MLGWGAGGGVGEGSSYVEGVGGRPDAVAGRADDGALVDVAGADEACRAELAVRINTVGEAGLDSFPDGMSGVSMARTSSQYILRQARD